MTQKPYVASSNASSEVGSGHVDPLSQCWLLEQSHLPHWFPLSPYIPINFPHILQQIGTKVFTMPNNLSICTFLGCGRKLEHQKKTYRENMYKLYSAAKVRIEPRLLQHNHAQIYGGCSVARINVSKTYLNYFEDSAHYIQLHPV